MPGCPLDLDKLLAMIDRVDARGHLDPQKAQWCREGLCFGFDAGIDPEKLPGQREFKNYKSAEEARGQVSRAIKERVDAGKTLKLGPWTAAGRTQLKRTVPRYIKSPVGAAVKYLDGVRLEEVRPFNDHTRVGTNDATDTAFYRHALDTLKRVAKGFLKDFYMRVADVSGAFTILPLSDKVRPCFVFSFFESDDDDVETLYVHTCGDFGTRGMYAACPAPSRSSSWTSSSRWPRVRW